MQAPVEICYAGVVIARAEEVREGEGGEFFVVMKDPPPVGTPLDVRSADSPVSVQVLHVVESADGAESGMQVRPVRPDDAGAAMWIPPPPAAKTASTPPAAATPAVAAPAVAEKPAQAAPEPAATASAPESPVASEEPARTPAVQLAFEAVEVVSPPAPSKEQAADHAPIAKAEQPAASEAVPSEPVAPAASTDSSAVPEAVSRGCRLQSDRRIGRGGGKRLRRILQRRRDAGRVACLWGCDSAGQGRSSPGPARARREWTTVAPSGVASRD